MGRVQVFAKGNLDVRDSLVAYRAGREVLWNGANEAVRGRFPGSSVRVRHETWTRSDALLEARNVVPAELLQRDLPLGPFTLASQFSRSVFETASDVIVLSTQPDLMVGLARHRRDGYLLHPYEFRKWASDDQAWFRAEFEPVPGLDPADSMRNLGRIIDRIRERSTASILIYNFSSVVPGESIHSYKGVAETSSGRIRRFNVALTDLSRDTGVSIVDVDAVVARGGADRLKTDPTHLTAEGARLVGEEVVRILEDLGHLPAST